MLNIVEDEQPWYASGLHFKCTECGQCCTGTPGYTWITEQEAVEIANFLNISLELFAKKYVRTVDRKLALLEDPRNFDCIFLKDRKCQVYPVRPKQCRTFPWWPRNLKSEKDWKEAARFCEGINAAAPLVPFETIQEQLDVQQNQ